MIPDSSKHSVGTLTRQHPAVKEQSAGKLANRFFAGQRTRFFAFGISNEQHYRVTLTNLYGLAERMRYKILLAYYLTISLRTKKILRAQKFRHPILFSRNDIFSLFECHRLRILRRSRVPELRSKLTDSRTVTALCALTQ